MPCTFTIDQVSFGAMTFAAGQYGRAFEASNPNENLSTYHPPGTVGDLTSTDGEGSRSIRCRARYRAADYPTIKAAIAAHREAWKCKSFDVIGDDGFTYSRCRLDKNGIRDTELPRALKNGATTLVQCTVEISLTCYGTATATA